MGMACVLLGWLPGCGSSSNDQDSSTGTGGAPDGGAPGDGGGLNGGGTGGMGAAGDGSGGAAGDGTGGSAEPLCQSWAQWPMPHPPETGLPNPASYDTDTEGVVIDGVTGLMWEREPSGDTFEWLEAAEHCENLSLAEYDDWVLPEAVELLSLVDITRQYPAQDTTLFPSGGEWTASLSTSLSDLPPGRRPVAVTWSEGRSITFEPDDERTVRCVRRTDDAPAGPCADQYTITDATVVDPRTSLIWQRVIPATQYTFEEAESHCDDLELDGHADWRLPSMKELLTLTLAEGSDSLFPSDVDHGAYFWTSTLSPGGMTAWFVTSGGGSNTTPLTGTYAVRCVRVE